MGSEGIALLYWTKGSDKPAMYMNYYKGGPTAPTTPGSYWVWWEDKYREPSSAAMVWNHNLRTFQILAVKKGVTPNVKDIGVMLEASCSSMLPLAEWHSGVPMYGSLLCLDGQTTASVANATQDDSATTDRNRDWSFGMARNVRDQLQPRIAPQVFDDKTWKDLQTQQWPFVRVQKSEPKTNTTNTLQRGFSQLVSLPFSTKVYGLKRTGDKQLCVSSMPVSAFNNILVSPDFVWGDLKLNLPSQDACQAATMIAVQGSNPNTAPQLHVFWVDQPGFTFLDQAGISNSTSNALPGTGLVGGICTATVPLRDMSSGVYGEFAIEPGQWSITPQVTRLGATGGQNNGWAATTQRLVVVRCNEWIALYFNNAQGQIMVTYQAVGDGLLKGTWSQPIVRQTGALMAACSMPLSVIPF